MLALSVRLTGEGGVRMSCEECRKRKMEAEQDMWAELDAKEEAESKEDIEPPEPNMRIGRR